MRTHSNYYILYVHFIVQYERVRKKVQNSETRIKKNSASVERHHNKNFTKFQIHNELGPNQYLLNKL